MENIFKEKKAKMLVLLSKHAKEIFFLFIGVIFWQNINLSKVSLNVLMHVFHFQISC